MNDREPMDEKHTDTPQPDQKEWLTPELIVEEITDLTRGGTGRAPVFGGENKVTTYYHS
jgi:hypothetical protein